MGTATSLFSLLIYFSLSSNILSNSVLIPFSNQSFLDTPDTAIIVSLSVIHAICPVVLFKVSAYSDANSESSPIGEYFLSITCPSLSVNISKGSPSFILNVLLISFGITTLPKSSILLTTPVAFIFFLLIYNNYLLYFLLLQIRKKLFIFLCGPVMFKEIYIF